MALELRYKGEFLSRASTLWRVEILQESAFPYEDVGELTFDADNAVQIEWSEDDKMAAVIGSTATLKIISPTDRQYIDLYTVAVGQIRMDVYREDELYWRGMLDPEFYEEPYEMLDGYTVSLTFSDFGILDRLVFNRGDDGTSDLESIVLECLERAGLEYETVQTYISTSLSATDRAMKLSDLSVRNSNFYDEEGEAMSMQEVLEGVLQPLSLRIMQKAGQIYVYDLNALYYQGEQKLIVWSGASQNLGVDSTYNNIKITFSPYAQNLEMSDEVWDDEIDETLCPHNWNTDLYGQYLDDDTSKAHVFGVPYYLPETESYDYQDAGYSIWTSKNGKTVTVNNMTTVGGMNPDGIVHPLSPRYFKFVPYFLGEEHEGIMVRFTPNYKYAWRSSHWLPDIYYYGLDVMQVNGGCYAESMKTSYAPHNYIFISRESIEVPLLPDPDNYGIRLTMDTYISSKYSPFHDEEPSLEITIEEGTSDEKKITSGTDLLKAVIQFVLVPVQVVFETDDGDVYYWENVESVDSEGYPALTPTTAYNTSQMIGKWTRASDISGYPKSFIAYYSLSDPETGNAPCVDSWATNSLFTGLVHTALPRANKFEGQCIAYPNFNKPGKMTLAVYTDWLFYMYRPRMDTYAVQTIDNDFNDCLRWVLCKAPQLEICSNIANNVSDYDIVTDDLEFSAVINPDAKEDLEIDTVCGTGTLRPTARGAYYRTESTQMMGDTFTRNGLTGSVEELMIATAYSQYAERHTTLEGESEIDTDGLHVYTEQNQEDRLFLAVDIVENLIQDTADTTYVELSYDDYEPER